MVRIHLLRRVEVIFVATISRHSRECAPRILCQIQLTLLVKECHMNFSFPRPASLQIIGGPVLRFIVIQISRHIDAKTVAEQILWIRHKRHHGHGVFLTNVLVHKKGSSEHRRGWHPSPKTSESDHMGLVNRTLRSPPFRVISPIAFRVGSDVREHIGMLIGIRQDHGVREDGRFHGWNGAIQGVMNVIMKLSRQEQWTRRRNLNCENKQ